MGHQWNMIQRISQFLSSTQGRDKSCRLIQYIAMFVSSVMKERLKYKKDGNKQYEKVLKMEKLSSTMQMTRKVLRLGKPASNLMQMIISIKKLINSHGNKPQETKFLLVMKALKDFFLMSYYVCDHFVWLSKISILTKESLAKRIETIGYFCWLLALIVIIGYEIEYLRNTHKLTKGMEWTGDEAQRKKMQQLYLEIQKCIFELIRAVFDIPVINFVQYNISQIMFLYGISTIHGSTLHLLVLQVLSLHILDVCKVGLSENLQENRIVLDLKQTFIQQIKMLIHSQEIKNLILI